MKTKKSDIIGLLSVYGGPDRIRTCDRLLRRQMLYPAELRDHLRKTRKQKNFLRLQRYKNRVQSQIIWHFYFCLVFRLQLSIIDNFNKYA